MQNFLELFLKYRGTTRFVTTDTRYFECKDSADIHRTPSVAQ